MAIVLGNRSVTDRKHWTLNVCVPFIIFGALNLLLLPVSSDSRCCEAPGVLVLVCKFQLQRAIDRT